MREFLRPVAVSLAATMLLSGCATMGGGNRPMTPEEAKLREQASTYNQTILEGILVGCAAGAATGAVVSNKNRGQNALIGCAAGGLLGGAAGGYIADKQEQYATKEQQLDAMIADVKAENERVAAVAATTHKVLAADKARIEAIDSELAAGKITMAQAKTKMAAVDDNSAYVDNTIKEMQKRKQNFIEAAASTKSSNPGQNKTMSAEITKLEQQIAQLQGERDALVQRRTVSRVG